MTFMERAAKVATFENFDDFVPLVVECINSRSMEAGATLQFLYDVDYDCPGTTELKCAAASALLAWGPEGMRGLTESAILDPSLKKTSALLQVYCRVAVGEQVPAFSVIVAERIASAVSDWPLIEAAARQNLHTLLLGLPDPEDIIYAISGPLMNFMVERSSAGSVLLAAVSARWAAISASTLQNYANLIKTAPNDEPSYQAFLEEHPQLLDPMAFQVWTRPDLHGAKEPDFVIRRTDNSYLVVEIEVPGKSLVTGGNQLSAQATQAVTQALSYKAFLMERFQEATRTFPEFREPECLVVIGLESTLNAEQRTALLRENQHRAGLKIVGFDWVMKRAEAISQNIIESRVKVQRVRMY